MSTTCIHGLSLILAFGCFNTLGSPHLSAAEPETSPKTIENTGELNIVFKLLEEKESTFKGLITVKNPNASYAWNGTFFALWNITFDTTSQITGVSTAGGGVSCQQTGDVATLDLGYQSLFPYSKTIEVTLEGQKKGNKPLPQNFTPHYVRSENIRYPKDVPLPPSWQKGKADLEIKDLIADPSEYYNAKAKPITDTAMLYNPPSKTQVQIGQVKNVGYPVNGAKNVRIWIPTKLMALGLAFAQEEVGINPNWLTAIGCKENFAAAITQDPNFNGIKVTLDGSQWTWPIAAAHPDGPYQVESGNFRDIAAYFADYYPPNAQHGQFMTVSADLNNLNWFSAAFTAALSLTITREQLNASKETHYNDFLDQAKDPTAELTVLTFAFNRGMGSLCERRLFTTNRAKALASSNICKDFDMGGFASHIPTTLAVTTAMNTDLSDIYDEKITWADMQMVLAKLRCFFANGVPSDDDWTSMTKDLEKAFGLLAQHWGGNHISLRYDFLTMLRIIKAYRPQPYHPRPTTTEWYYRVKGMKP